MSNREKNIQKLIGFAIGGISEIKKDNFNFNPTELFVNGRIENQTELDGGKYQFDFEFDVMCLDIESSAFLQDKGDQVMKNIRGVTYHQGDSKIGYKGSKIEPDTLRISIVSDKNVKNIANSLKAKIEVVSDYVAKNIEVSLLAKNEVDSSNSKVEKPGFFQLISNRLGFGDSVEKGDRERVNLITLEEDPTVAY